MGKFDWIRPSTRSFLREAKTVKGYRFFDLLHGLVYMRWPYLYIAVGTGRHPWAKKLQPMMQWIGRRIEAAAGPAGQDGRKPGFADTYHGKVLPLEAARQLVHVQEDIRIENLEQVIPYARARDIVMKNPEQIAVMDCPCRVSRPNPCTPLDVCLVVGEPFAS